MRAVALELSDMWVLAVRSSKRIPRQPDLLIGFTVQPVMFVLLFVYVFGGAISAPGYSSYVDYLIPGIIVQTIAFGGFVTALGLTDDLKKGLMDRFRSLPMSRAAVLTGRTLADVSTNIVQIVVVLGVGLLVGFTFTTSAADVVAGALPAPADRLRVLVGVRLRRPRRLVARVGERLRLHHPLPAHVRLLGVRARRLDAGLAPADRRAQPVHRHGRRHPRSLRRQPRRERPLDRHRVGGRNHARVRRPRHLALPASRRSVTRRATPLYAKA